MEGLEKAYPLSYGLSYETKAVVSGTAETFDLYGESAGIRTQDPRLKRAVQWPKHTLQINSLQIFRKINGSQFRQRNFKHLYDLSISVF